MKVRILSGNQTGAVVEMPDAEAQANIATGYAVAVEDEGVASKAAAEPEESHVQPRHQSRADLRRQARERDENDDTL